MDFSLATFSALLLLLAAASSAPAGPPLQDACADVKLSSLELNQIARTVSVEARNGDKSVSHFNSSVLWMESSDMCDPENLRQTSATCIKKMLDVLTAYSSVVEEVSRLQSCSKHVEKLRPAINDLQQKMTKCVNSKTGMNYQMPNTGEVDSSDQPDGQGFLDATRCHYVLDRLFSFSILSARVFALGDPAHHSDGSAQRCM